MIAILDLGISNASSISNMLRVLGIACVRTKSLADIESANKLILPGIGSFDAGRQRLEDSGLLPVLNTRILEERMPVLGICLGMQLMTEGSEEGRLPGLGWVKGRTRRFSFTTTPKVRVPHMGWNNVAFHPDNPLGRGFGETPRFYFVHSFHVELPGNSSMLTGCTTYGYQFTSAFSERNLHGVQFHPEKSHSFGLRLLRNFAALP
jgi:glutamine amidotransferase